MSAAGLIACGGPQYNDSYVVNNNCVTFAGGAWVTSHNLAVERGAHLSTGLWEGIVHNGLIDSKV